MLSTQDGECKNLKWKWHFCTCMWPINWVQNTTSALPFVKAGLQLKPGHKTGSGDPVCCPSMATPCGPGKLAEIPITYHRWIPELRYASGLRGHKEQPYLGADGTIGRPLGGGAWKKEGQIWTSGPQLSRAGLEGEVYAFQRRLKIILAWTVACTDNT